MTTAATVEALAKVITGSDIAKLAGVERSTVSNWKRRYAEDFPKPIGEIAGSDVYDRAQIIAWLQTNARRRLDQARNTQKEAQESLARAEAALEDVQAAWNRVRRLRK